MIAPRCTAFAAAAALAAVAAVGCAHGGAEEHGRGASSPADRLVPAGAGAVVYASHAGAAAGAPAGDPLRDAILVDVKRAAAEMALSPPEPDVRLDAALGDLARVMHGDELPAFEVVDFLLAHYGLPEPAPHLVIARAAAGAEVELREQVAAQLIDALRAAPVARVGVGVDRGAAGLAVVLGLQERAVDLTPVPRRLPPGGRTPIEGRLRAGHSEPKLVVTAPGGSVRELAVFSDGAGFRGELRCDAGAGRYQVEITGTDTGGTGVVANFPVFCGVDPPAASPRGTAVVRDGFEPAKAERAILDFVNNDRGAAGLPALRWDDALASIARAHSRDMADHDFVGHVSPRTGNAFDRAQRAGLRPQIVMENVGRAYSSEEAERGLMMSPGHRANILDPRARRIGVGVVAGRPGGPGDAGVLYVTQMFTD